VKGQCSAGSTSCAAAQTNCGAVGCVNLASDPKHCGSCGHSCKSGLKCVKGQCSTDTGGGSARCAAGDVNCSGKCVNPATDPKHCGSCGHVCKAGQKCVKGKCKG
jgi:hypothetical protein